MISLNYLSNNLEQIGTDAEQQLYLTRIALLIPTLRTEFQNCSDINSIIDSLISISQMYQIPIYKYLCNSINEIDQSKDTNNIQINYLNEKQKNFIINNLEKFKNIIRYLIIGNREIEKSIPDELYNSANKKSLFLFVENV